MTTEERLDAVAMNLELVSRELQMLTGLVHQTTTNVERLALVAESHNRRISQLEDGK
jgi:hypothetical protein